jgi:hypothetical protein
MTSSTLGIIGGITGTVIGIIGGLIGTYFTMKNVEGPLEKKFVTRICIMTWTGLIVVAGVAFLIPSPYRIFAFTPVWFCLPFLIPYWNKRQFQYRKLDQDVTKPEAQNED